MFICQVQGGIVIFNIFNMNFQYLSVFVLNQQTLDMKNPHQERPGWTGDEQGGVAHTGVTTEL